VGGGFLNQANGYATAVGGGCDNIAGGGTKNTNSCGAGGEGIVGGASVGGSQKDGTYGVISDGVNFTTPGSISIDANAAPGPRSRRQCAPRLSC
jgi:hypothetical protein